MDGIRDRTLALLDESAAVLGFEPRVVFDGPVDALVTEPVAADLLATLREALTNVARHANAGRVDVSLTASDDVVLTVVDDGVGTPRPVTTQGRGLGNMAARATRHHGTLQVDRGSVWRHRGHVAGTGTSSAVDHRAVRSQGTTSTGRADCCTSRRAVEYQRDGPPPAVAHHDEVRVVDRVGELEERGHRIRRRRVGVRRRR